MRPSDQSLLKKTPRKKPSSSTPTDQESIPPASSARSRTAKKESAIKYSDTDVQATPNPPRAHLEGSKKTPKPRRSVLTKRKLEDQLESEEPHQSEVQLDSQTHHQHSDSSTVPVKRRKSEFPIQTSTIETSSSDHKAFVKKKNPSSSKSKAGRRTTLHQVIEAGEGNYSDFNPFQSRNDEEDEKVSGGSAKKPSKRLSSVPRPSSISAAPRLSPPISAPRPSSSAKTFPRPSLVPSSQMPKSTTTSNISPTKASRRTPSHPTLSANIPKSATMSNVPRVSQTPHQIFGPRKSGYGAFESPDFSTETPEQILRQLVPAARHRGPDDHDGHEGNTVPARAHFGELNAPTSQARRQSQHLPKTPYPQKYPLPTTPRVRLNELAHTPTSLAEKKLKIRKPLLRVRHGARGWSLSSVLGLLLQLSILAGLGLLCNWYRTQTLELGYCDTGSNTNRLTRDRAIDRLIEGPLSTEGAVSQILEASAVLGLLPTCTPCPSHGLCEKGYLEKCETDYVLVQSRIGRWFGGVLPLGWTGWKCMPDTAKLVKIAEMANEILQVLGKRRGEVVCKLGMAGISGHQEGGYKAGVIDVDVKKFGMLEDDLKEIILEKFRSRNHDNSGGGDGDDEIFKLALKDLTKFEEIALHHQQEQQLEGGVGKIWIGTTNSKYIEMGLKCRVKLGMYKLIKRFKLVLLSLICVGIGWVYLRIKFRGISEEKKKVKELVEITLSKLRDESWVHHTNPAVKPNAFIASAHLRDLILSYEHSPSARQKLWKKVEKIIEGNSNIRTKLSEQRGESIKVWEWIGSYTGDLLNLKSSPAARYKNQNSSPRNRPVDTSYHPYQHHQPRNGGIGVVVEEQETTIPSGDGATRPTW